MLNSNPLKIMANYIMFSGIQPSNSNENFCTVYYTSYWTVVSKMRAST